MRESDYLKADKKAEKDCKLTLLSENQLQAAELLANHDFLRFITES
jgi:hypothetical protein